ncbi:7711_t:CDS:10 [Paraglomus occultum]|uniref:7711_t:CDS:1 n=1 Tax=Paraglomus occultum TaxID=144539 RepID=A0A9N9DF87_9GLOM|nr:7711_t:CDS:10 [Paraglomus occultum]
MTTSNPFFPGSDGNSGYLFRRIPPKYFLLAKRNTIVNSPPYTDDWRGLDGAWASRFLKRVEQLASKETYEQLIVKNSYEYESLNLLEISGNVSSRKIEHKLVSELPIDSKRQVTNVVEEDGIRTPRNQTSIDEDVLKAAAENLTRLDDVKYFQEFVPLFERYKEQQRSNVYSCTNDDVMDIRGDSGFARFLTVSQYAKLLSVRPKRKAVVPECWREVVDEYFMDSVTKGGRKKILADWVHITDSLVKGKDGDTEDVTRIKRYLYRVMSPLIESFLKPIPDISSPNTSEHHYWSEFGHRFFSKALQDFVGLDWRVMEVPVFASKYRKNYGLDLAVQKVVEGKYADLLAWSWETGEEFFIGEQAGPPTEPDLTKFAMDSFKLYRELRDCLNVRILHAMEKGDDSYSDRAVFGVLGYLFEMKMLIMWKDGIYVYEEFGSLTIASHWNKIYTMKAGILKLLEFMMVMKMEVNHSTEIDCDTDNDKIQILKRKFNEITQTGKVFCPL